MTIAVTDTQTGQALTVHEVTAALDRAETPMLWSEEIDAWHIKKRGRTFSAALSEMRAAMQLAGDRLDECGIGRIDGGRSGRDPEQHGPDWSDWQPGDRPSCQCGYNGTPEECASWRCDLPPDPALQLAPERLDADHAQAMAIQAERRRRMDALAPIGQRTAMPWSRRVRTWASGWAEWLKPSGGEPR